MRTDLRSVFSNRSLNRSRSFLNDDSVVVIRTDSRRCEEMRRSPAVQGKSEGHRRHEVVGCGERIEGTAMIW